MGWNETKAVSRSLVVSTLVAAFTDVFLMLVLAPLIPVYLKANGWSPSQAAALFTADAAVTLVLAPFVVPLLGWVGLRRVVCLAPLLPMLVCTSLGTIGSNLPFSLLMLLRSVQGVASTISGVTIASSQAIAVPPELQNRAGSMVSIANSCGALSGLGCASLAMGSTGNVSYAWFVAALVTCVDLLCRTYAGYYMADELHLYTEALTAEQSRRPGLRARVARGVSLLRNPKVGTTVVMLTCMILSDNGLTSLTPSLAVDNVNFTAQQAGFSMTLSLVFVIGASGAFALLAERVAPPSVVSFTVLCCTLSCLSSIVLFSGVQLTKTTFTVLLCIDSVLRTPVILFLYPHAVRLVLDSNNGISDIGTLFPVANKLGSLVGPAVASATFAESTSYVSVAIVLCSASFLSIVAFVGAHLFCRRRTITQELLWNPSVDELEEAEISST